MTGSIEIWASPEPTVARVDASSWRDQLKETGHERREDDVERLASLQIKATRYPVLWEKVAPHHPDERDYRWSDRRLTALRDAGIEPIVTLLHHGSGPRYTSLVDPLFPQRFAAFAESTARRYPWVRRWTPINEPLTTARFSTLYRAWYPNRFFDHAAFGRAMVYEALAIQQAMQAIRRHVPDAELILTEDLQGFRALDPGVAEYVEHKSQRRFLSAELVMGRVDERHPLWTYLTDTCEVPMRDVKSVQYFAQPIDLMGWNYYPNSERVLMSDGPGRSRNVALVDVEPARLDPRARLLEAAARLDVPIALSEVHCIGTERERARWMLQRFADLLAVNAAGADVRAFGAWAAFGMVDWSSLLCRREGHHEDGVFTFAGPMGTPQPTLVAEVVRALATGRAPNIPAEPGWWERSRDAVA